MNLTTQLKPNEQVSLCEALDRVLHKGAVVVGDVTISVAGVDLLYLRLQLILTSVEKLLEDNNKLRM
jgi:Gas vesicle protein